MPWHQSDSPAVDDHDELRQSVRRIADHSLWDSVLDVCVASGSQVAASRRWHRLRRYWLCAGVCISNERAAMTAVADVDGSKRLKWGDGRRWSGSESVAVLLGDDRMLAHDDGEGRPLRYMSLYGGMVTSML